MKLLSIQIPTVVGREKQFNRLYNRLFDEIEEYDLGADVEVIYCRDNKEMSIGVKRQLLLDKCDAVYFVQIDDDDDVRRRYVHDVVKILRMYTPDCIGYLEQCIINGQKKIACHSNRFLSWGENIQGFDYVRTIFCKDVIKTEIARKIGFADMRFGEDYDFSKRLKESRLLEIEYFVNDVMYYYESNTLNQNEHNERYGISLSK